MNLSDEDGRQAIDAMRADMAAHQRRTGREATDTANTALASPLITQIGNTPDASACVPATPPPAKPDGTFLRELDGRKYLVERESVAPPLPIIKANQEQAWFLPRALARVNKLLSLGDRGIFHAASWRERTLAVMAIANKAKAWRAAAENPAELLRSRDQLAKNQADLKRLGLETVSQLTPAFATAKASELGRQYLAQFCALLEDSNALGFGDWKAELHTKVSASG